MQIELATGKLLVAGWFAISVLAAVIGNAALYVWLRRRGAPLAFGLAGVPGYLIGAYLRWCQSQGRSGKKVAVLQWAIILNALIAGVTFIVLLGGSK